MSDDQEEVTDVAGLLEKAAPIYRDATAKHAGVDDNRDPIHDTFNEQLSAEFGAKRITLTAKEQSRLAVDYAWQTLNSRAGSSTQQLLKQIASGQMPLFEIESLLDTVLTAGEARRVLLRNIQPTDIARMVAARKNNEEKVKQARIDFEAIAAKFLAWLAEYGTFTNALKEGAVAQPATPDEDAGEADDVAAS